MSSDYESVYLQYRGFLYKKCLRFKDYCEMDDLMQMAYLALHKACDTYKEDMDTSWMHYLALCVKWTIIRELNQTKDIIRVPSHMNDKIQRYKRTRSELSHELFREPFVHEIAKRMKISASEAEATEDTIRMQVLASLDAQLSEDGDFTLADTLLDTEAEEMGADAERKELRKQLWAAVRNRLDDDAFDLIHEHFIVGTSVAEIARRKGVASQGMSESQRKALKKLQKDKQIQQIGKECGYTVSFRHVTYAEWKTSFTSAVEVEVLAREKRIEERRARMIEAQVENKK